MGYYRAGGGWPWQGSVGGAGGLPSGEEGAAVADAIWAVTDPEYAKALKGDSTSYAIPGSPLDLKRKKEAEMGYYSAGGGVLKSDANAAGWTAPTFGGGSGGGTVVPLRDTAADPGGGEDRKRPRMNPTNIRALRRSMRRVTSFARIAKRVMTFTHSHKMKGRRKRAFGK
jgi:hypothetical protein